MTELRVVEFRGNRACNIKSSSCVITGLLTGCREKMWGFAGCAGLKMCGILEVNCAGQKVDCAGN